MCWRFFAVLICYFRFVCFFLGFLLDYVKESHNYDNHILLDRLSTITATSNANDTATLRRGATSSSSMTLYQHQQQQNFCREFSVDRTSAGCSGGEMVKFNEKKTSLAADFVIGDFGEPKRHQMPNATVDLAGYGSRKTTMSSMKRKKFSATAVTASRSSWLETLQSIQPLVINVNSFFKQVDI